MIIFLFIEGIGVLFLFQKKVYTYQTQNAVISSVNISIVVVSKDMRKILYQNKQFMLNGKKQNYQIQEDKGIVLKRNKQNYYEIWLKTKIPKNNKPMDSIDFSIKDKKIKWIDLLKTIWGGDGE